MSEAIASGFPPFVRSDSATVTQGGSVSVLDSGQASVLANDFDFEGDPLVAVLTRNVEHGTLTFNADGTFIYRHDGSDEDDDEFRYRAFDGTSFSRFEARVEIEIEEGEPVPPRITGQRTVTVPEDGSVLIQLSDLIVVDPDNAYPADFTLEVNAGTNYAVSGSTVTPDADFNGGIAVPVRVNDGMAFSNLFNLAVDVVPQNDPPFTVGAPSDQEAVEDERFVLALAGFFDDIDDGDSLSYSATGLPASGSLTVNANNGRLSGTPIRADVSEQAYSVRVTVTDDAGQSASVSFSLLIFSNNRSDLAVTGSLVGNPTMVGESARWDLLVENFGPADLAEGQLDAVWTTSGPPLSLIVPPGCTIADNDTARPSMTCLLEGLAVGEVRTITIDGTQQADGDSTLTVNVTADDPVAGNNSLLLGAQTASAFSEGPTQVIDQPGGDLVAHDLNGDGLLDVVAAGDETVVYLNAGTRSFDTSGTSLGAGSMSDVVAVADWNGDQVADVVIGGAGAVLYLGDAAGAFGDGETLPIGGQVRALGAADFDGDGFEDLLLTGDFGTVLLANRGGTQLEEVAAQPGSDLAVADFNNDGFADIAIVVAGNIDIFANDGMGGFARLDALSIGSVVDLNTADVDGDGVVDLLVVLSADAVDPPRNQVLYGQAGGGFAEGPSFGASAVSSLLAGDVDADGVMDIVAINNAGVHQVYRGADGDGFELDGEQIVSAGMRFGVLVDFNADQSLDLIMSGVEAGVIEVHANNGAGRLGLGDRIAPELTLLGEASITLAAGATFVDPGASASDDVDGNITARITTEGAVNSAAPGSYTIRYAVADRAGNTAASTRTVIVQVNEGVGGGGGTPGPLVLVWLMGALTAQARSRRRSVNTN